MCKHTRKSQENMGAAFSRARERPFFRLLPWPFRPRSRARRAKRPPASTAEDKSDAIEMEPVPQLTSALKQQDAAAQAEASIAEGKARAALDRLVAITNSGDAY